MGTVVKKKCERCGKEIFVRKDNSQENLQNTTTNKSQDTLNSITDWPCSISSQMSATEAWEKINNKDEKKYCLKCSIMSKFSK